MIRAIGDVDSDVGEAPWVHRRAVRLIRRRRRPRLMFAAAIAGQVVKLYMFACGLINPDLELGQTSSHRGR